MMYEMNCSEKEHSLIRMTGKMLCCVSVPIFFLPDQGDEGCSCTLSKLLSRCKVYSEKSYSA